jgi:hypothetical protein
VTVSQYVWWILLAAAIVAALFEWFVRAEHKTLIRLTGLGVLALALMIEVGCVVAAVILPWMILVPGLEKRSPLQPVSAQLAQVDSTLDDFKALLAKPQWTEADVERLQTARARAEQAVENLHRLGAAAPTLVALRHAPAEIHETRDAIDTAATSLRMMAIADGVNRTEELRGRLRQFLDAYERVPHPKPTPAGPAPATAPSTAP